MHPLARLSPYIELLSWLGPQERRRFKKCIALVIIISILEILSVSSAITFVSSVGNIQSGLIDSLRRLIEARVHALLPSVLLGLALALLIGKSFISLYANSYYYKTAAATKKFFQDLLYTSFLKNSLSSQLHSHSDIQRLILLDMTSLEGRLFVPLLVIVGEFVPAVFGSLIVLAVFPSLFGFLLIGFSIASFAILKSTNSTLERLGALQQFEEGRLIKVIHESYHGFIEIVIYGLSKTWIDIFSDATAKAAAYLTKALRLSLLPRFTFELSIYIIFGLFISIRMMQGLTVGVIITEITLVAGLTLRLLPSVSKIIAHIQSFRHAYKPTVEVLAAIKHAPLVVSMDSTNLEYRLTFSDLILEHVNFTFENHLVISDFSTQIAKGEFIGIIGPSGCGKSTLLSLMMGLRSPSSGKIRVNGLPLSFTMANWWGNISYVPQSPFIIDDTLINNVFIGRSFDIATRQKALSLLYSLRLIESHSPADSELYQNAKALSGGQQQRLALARALLRNPQILFLDEPTSAQDSIMQTKILDIIREQMRNRTVIMITHRPEPLTACTRIIRL